MLPRIFLKGMGWRRRAKRPEKCIEIFLKKMRSLYFFANSEIVIFSTNAFRLLPSPFVCLALTPPCITLALSFSTVLNLLRNCAALSYPVLAWPGLVLSFPGLACPYTELPWPCLVLLCPGSVLSYPSPLPYSLLGLT